MGDLSINKLFQPFFSSSTASEPVTSDPQATSLFQTARLDRVAWNVGKLRSRLLLAACWLALPWFGCSGEAAPAAVPSTTASASDTEVDKPADSSAIWRDLSWVLLGPGRAADDSYAAACADFDATQAQLEAFLRDAQRVENIHQLDFYPCWVDAKAQSPAGEWRLRLRIGSVGELQGPSAADSATLYCADCEE